MSPYGKATFAIPFTRTAEARQAPLLYPRRLYVNSKSAIMAGKVFYAMPKVWSDIKLENTRFTATGARGMKIEACFQQHLDPAPCPVTRHRGRTRIF